MSQMLQQMVRRRQTMGSMMHHPRLTVTTRVDEG